MKKILFVLLGITVAISAYFVFSAYGKNNVEAYEVAGNITFNGTAYIAGQGGHVAIIDLSTMKAPTHQQKERIVITDPGGEMEGIIAGMEMAPVKKAGGIHGVAMQGDKLVVGLLNGNVVSYDVKTQEKSKPISVGKKFCGIVVGPDGNLYMEDMADGNVYVWDAKGLKLVDKMPVGKAVCGIAWTRNNDKAYVSDMPLGVVYVIDWKTKKTIKEIKDPEMTFIHMVGMTPDKRYLWVAAPNEFDPGLKPGTHKSQIVVIDTNKDTVVDHIVLPDDVRPHGFEFSPDGKHVLLAARTYKDDSLLVVMDFKSKKIERTVSACNACHQKHDVELKQDNGSPISCGIAVNWTK